MRKVYLITFLLFLTCGANETTDLESSVEPLNVSENKEVEVDENFESNNLENSNFDDSQTGSFILPVFNGACIYSETEAVQELQTLRESNNLRI